MKQPSDIFAIAKRRRKKNINYICMSEFEDTIILLYEKKNFTFQEVTDFFNENGIEVSWHTIRRVYKTYRNKKREANTLLQRAQEVLSA